MDGVSSDEHRSSNKHIWSPIIVNYKYYDTILLMDCDLNIQCLAVLDIRL